MITIYTKPNCVQCVATKRWLDKRNITYTTIDVTTNSTAYNHIKDLGYTTVPVIFYKETHWGGFQPERLKCLETKTLNH